MVSSPLRLCRAFRRRLRHVIASCGYCRALPELQVFLPCHLRGQIPQPWPPWTTAAGRACRGVSRTICCAGRNCLPTQCIGAPDADRTFLAKACRMRFRRTSVTQRARGNQGAARDCDQVRDAVRRFIAGKPSIAAMTYDSVAIHRFAAPSLCSIAHFRFHTDHKDDYPLQGCMFQGRETGDQLFQRDVQGRRRTRHLCRHRHMGQ